MRKHMRGGDMVALASGEKAPTAIAVDESAVVWFASGVGQVRALLKGNATKSAALIPPQVSAVASGGGTSATTPPSACVECHYNVDCKIGRGMESGDLPCCHPVADAWGCAKAVPPVAHSSKATTTTNDKPPPEFHDPY